MSRGDYGQVSRSASDEVGDLFAFARPAWQADAACSGMDPALFYPERGESIDDAVAVCDGCPVQVQCREYGMTEHYGIWGSLAEQGRRRVRASRRLDEAATRKAAA